MIANLDKNREMSKLLSNKNRVNTDLISHFGRFGLQQTLRRLGMEKQQGVSALQLIISLCFFRINGESIYSMYRKDLHSLLETGKNFYYSMLNRESMDWRTLLMRMSVRFLAIQRKEGAEESGQPLCYIVDDTTLEKTGVSMEGVSRVFDHVKHKCVVGYKLLLLAFFDGRSTILVDFSLHREKGEWNNYGLSEEERRGQYGKKRDFSNSNQQRAKGMDAKKIDNALEMMRRAWKSGFHTTYALCDSWFTYEKFIHGVRSIGDGSLHFLGMGKMVNRKSYVRGFYHNVYQMISYYERTEAKRDWVYNYTYFRVNGRMGEPVRIFFIRDGSNKNWNIIITTDFRMDIKKCFEIYQKRWNVEILKILKKESKGYLGLGKYQGRDLDGQIADCIFCYMTYMVMALDKRLNDYETFGEMFREQRDALMSLMLWKRVLDIIRRIMKTLADLIGISPEELLDNIIGYEKTPWKYMDMIDALELVEDAA